MFFIVFVFLVGGYITINNLINKPINIDSDIKIKKIK